MQSTRDRPRAFRSYFFIIWDGLSAMVAVLLAPGAPTLSQCYIIAINLVVCKNLIKRRGVTLGVQTGTHAKKLERLTGSYSS